MAGTSAYAHKAAKFDAAIAEIRRQFRNSLLKRILLLENLAEAIRAGDDSQENFDLIAGCCHKISGTAPTLGFPEIGRRARLIEEQIRDAGNATPRSVIWRVVERELETLLDHLEGELDQNSM